MSLGVLCHRRCPVPRRHCWICQGHIPLPGIARSGFGRRCCGLAVRAGRGAAPGGMLGGCWTVTLGPVVLGSPLKPRGAGGHPERQSAEQRRALSLPVRGVLGQVSGLSFPTCKGLCVLAEVVSEHPGGCGVQVPSAGGEHCPHGMLVLPNPWPGARGGGEVCGGPMVLVMSPASRTSGPCAREQAAALTHETSPGSSTPGHAEPNHRPRPCFGAVPPLQTPGDAGGASNLRGGGLW